MKSAITTPDAPSAEFAYSQGVEVGGHIWVCGQVGNDAITREPASPDIGGQTRKAILNSEAILHAAGSSLSDVVMVHVYLASMDDFAGYDEAYRQLFPSPYPARVTVQAGVQPWRIELTMTAVKGSGVAAESRPE